MSFRHHSTTEYLAHDRGTRVACMRLGGCDGRLSLLQTPSWPPLSSILSDMLTGSVLDGPISWPVGHCQVMRSFWRGRVKRMRCT